MKQLFQDLKSGELSILEFASPKPSRGEVLISGSQSLVSPGTERMLLEFGKASFLGKAMQQPARVKQALNKMKTDGVLPTLEAIKSKLSEPIALGYSYTGTVATCGDDQVAAKFPPGTRVVANGHHGDLALAPHTLTASIPDNVSDDQASFTVLGAISLQGIRLLSPTLGETVLVIGLGPVGLLAIQLLKANGCRVLAADINQHRAGIGEQMGAKVMVTSEQEEMEAWVLQETGRRGADAVLVSAATNSNEPLLSAARCSRMKGRVVLVGVTGMTIDRSEFFRKELTFHVSSSYGPGRYDERYQAGDIDYPEGYIRWTAGRNFEAVLHLMSSGQLDPTPLISKRYDFDRVDEAYKALEDPHVLGIILSYPEKTPSATGADQAVMTHSLPKETSSDTPGLAIIGCGQFARRFLLPSIMKQSWQPIIAMSSRGASAARVAERYRFHQSTTDYTEALNHPDSEAVVIASRHSDHGGQVAKALSRGLHTFVEKPLATSLTQLQEIVSVYTKKVERPILLTGFNRRFSPMAGELKDFFLNRAGPIHLVYRVNGGRLPTKGWLSDRAREGNRLIGEGCHFIDTLCFLVGRPWQSLSAFAHTNEQFPLDEDGFSLTLTFEDGSLGTVHYLCDGPNKLVKERLEVTGGGRHGELLHFRELRLMTQSRNLRRKSRRPDKGHREEMRQFHQAVTGNDSDLPTFDEMIDVTLATFAGTEAIRSGTVQNRRDWRKKLWGDSAVASS